MTNIYNHDFLSEVRDGDRFEFGANWKNFLSTLNDIRIKAAEASLQDMLNRQDLKGLTFLDVGSGSGLFSLAARNLGAQVVSFDFDKSSVWCTKHLKETFYPDDKNWTIKEGSVLDKGFLNSLGNFDIVYSWGVLHHTGDMWSALENVKHLCNNDSQLFIALYNDQGIASKYWYFVKLSYNKVKIMRPIWTLVHLIYPTLPSVLLRFVTRRERPRGMTVWYDLLDWLGGYPFEISKPNQITGFFESHGFETQTLVTVGKRMGCNEYVFKKITK